MAMKVLETRPCISCGVSFCEMVCAGTTTKAMAEPRRKVLSAAVALKWKAPSSVAPRPMPNSPPITRSSIRRFAPADRTANVPTINPTPTIALMPPYTIGPRWRMSRM